jgi:hypothetical protein
MAGMGETLGSPWLTLAIRQLKLLHDLDSVFMASPTLPLFHNLRAALAEMSCWQTIEMAID